MYWAVSSAPRTVAPGSTSTNSSPPWRAASSPARRAAFLTTWATACRQASPAAWPSASFTMPAPNGSVTDENTTGTCGAMPCAEFTACADGVALTCSTAGWARSS